MLGFPDFRVLWPLEPRSSCGVRAYSVELTATLALHPGELLRPLAIVTSSTLSLALSRQLRKYPRVRTIELVSSTSALIHVARSISSHGSLWPLLLKSRRPIYSRRRLLTSQLLSLHITSPSRGTRYGTLLESTLDHTAASIYASRHP